MARSAPSRRCSWRSQKCENTRPTTSEAAATPAPRHAKSPASATTPTTIVTSWTTATTAPRWRSAAASSSSWTSSVPGRRSGHTSGVRSVDHAAADPSSAQPGDERGAADRGDDDRRGQRETDELRRWRGELVRRRHAGRHLAIDEVGLLDGERCRRTRSGRCDDSQRARARARRPGGRRRRRGPSRRARTPRHRRAARVRRRGSSPAGSLPYWARSDAAKIS